MSTSEEKLRQLMQEKLGNMESPVNPGLWNGIQAGLNATAGSTGASSGLVKMAWMKVAGIATGAIAIGAITIGILNRDNNDPVTQQSVSEIQRALPEAVVTPGEESNTSESKPHFGTLYTPINAVDAEEQDLSANETAPLPTPLEERPDNVGDLTSVKGAPDLPETENQKPNVPSNSTNYAAETVSAGFSFVNSPGMGLEYLFIPEYTRAAGYRWYVDDQQVSGSMSPSYEFSRAGEYVVQLEVLDENGQIITELSRNICIGGAPAWKIDANYFTPNGDGFSDVFDPAGQSENIIVTGLFIYNHRNQLIFSKTAGDLIWNGTDEYGNPMPDGQYLYRITGVDACDGKVEDKTGTMALRR